MKKQRVLITGGANGLGLALCKYYTDQGAWVSILDVESSDDAPRETTQIICDVRKLNKRSLAALSETSYDVVICNAGISVSGNFTDIDFKKEREVFDINTFGHIKLVKFLLQNHLVRDRGRVAFICSASVVFPFPIALAYSASKAALDGFAYALEAYLVPRRVSVTRVYPGPMNTGHSKYYSGASTQGGRRPEQSVPDIVRGIQTRRRRVFPDPISRVYRVLSKVMPGWLTRKAYMFYKDRIGLSR